MAKRVCGSASYATSGELVFSIVLGPPPLPFQPVSLSQFPAASTFSVVPPTATTLGEEAGHDVGAPVSPELVTNVMPPLMPNPPRCPAGVVRILSSDFWKGDSSPPQLIEIATTPGCCLA